MLSIINELKVVKNVNRISSQNLLNLERGLDKKKKKIGVGVWKKKIKSHKFLIIKIKTSFLICNKI